MAVRLPELAASLGEWEEALRSCYPVPRTDDVADRVHHMWMKLEEMERSAQDQRRTSRADAVVAQLLQCLASGMRHEGLHLRFGTPEALHLFVGIVGRDPHSPSAGAAVKCLNNALVANPQAIDSWIGARGPSTVVSWLEGVLPSSLAVPLFRSLMHLTSRQRPIRAALCAERGFAPALVNLLAQLLRREDPPFPLGSLRAEAAEALLQLMFAVGDHFFGAAVQMGSGEAQVPASGGGAGGAGGEAGKEGEWRTQLGLVLADALRWSVHRPGALSIQRRVAHLLLHMPAGYGFFLTQAGCLPALLDIVERDSAPLRAAEAARSLRARRRGAEGAGGGAAGVGASEPGDRLRAAAAEAMKGLSAAETQVSHTLAVVLRMVQESEAARAAVAARCIDRKGGRGLMARWLGSRTPELRRLAGETVWLAAGEDPERLVEVFGVGTVLPLLQAKNAVEIVQDDV